MEAVGRMVMATGPRERVEAQRGFRGAPGRLFATLRAALSGAAARWLSLLFLTGQALDVLTTHVALASGRFQEANPVFAPALASNQALALLVKLAAAGLVLLAALTKLSGTRRTVVLAVLAFISLEAPITNGLRMAGLL